MVNRFLHSACAVAALGMLASPVLANPFTYSATGIANATQTVKFDGASEGQDVSTLFSGQGVTFTGLWATNQYGSIFAPATAPSAINFIYGSAPTFSVNFTTPVSDVSFLMVTDGYGTTVSSYLGGNFVESLSFGAYNFSHPFFGFTDTNIDQLVFTVSGDTAALVDNVSFHQAVPEAGTWLMMIAGFGMTGATLRRRSAKIRFA